MADYPHIRLPFQYLQQPNGEQILAVTDEDTPSEIADCVELILRTEQGQRRPDPGFARPRGLVFTTDRVLAASMTQDAVNEYEPRAETIVRASDVDADDPGVLRLRAMWALVIADDEGGRPVDIEQEELGE